MSKESIINIIFGLGVSVGLALITTGFSPYLSSINQIFVKYIIGFGSIIVLICLVDISLLWLWSKSNMPKTIPILFISFGILLFSIGIMFRTIGFEKYKDTLLKVESYINSFDYQDGTVISGIKWEKGYADLRVNLFNDNNDYYSNIDLVFNTNISIISASVNSEFNKCNIVGVNPFFEITSFAIGENGEEAILPNPNSTIFILHKYRLICEKFLPHTDINLVFAVVQRILPTDRFVQDLFSRDRIDPKFLEINGSYFVNGKKFEVKIGNKYVREDEK